eukprot:55967-Eustigmatos_ZCMA.PRE.1
MKGETIQIDTTDILFICGGAFAGLEQVIGRRLTKASIGFGAELRRKGSTADVQGKCFENTEPEDM